jgi:hypothetical protein
MGYRIASFGHPAPFTLCHREEGQSPDAAIQRMRSGIPHYDLDWIATP